MRKLGWVFTVIGVLLLTASIFLCVYNMWDTKRATETAATALEILVSDNPQLSANEEAEITAIPDYQLNPAMDMPIQEADGQQYIGIIDLEEISVSLPVISDWDYQKLKLAPCRYSGSAYQSGFVIMAHNFAGHFGNLGDLSYGSCVTFTDVDGNIFEYQVTDMEVLERTDVEEMKSDAWDLTLFTCTVGGVSRIAVRCNKVQ